MSISDVKELFKKIIFENECGGDKNIAVKFSDPDGENSGKSGWSFGESQFDTKNNGIALTCLRECGFTEEEITGIVNQTIDVKPLESKLRDHADIIARYDDAQFEHCLNHAQVVLDKFNLRASDDAAFLAVADYINQYGSLDPVNKPTYLVGYLSSLGRVYIAKDILDFKINNTKYGREHKADCQRRYMNLLKIVQNS